MKQIFNFCGKYLNEKKGILTLYILICIFGSMTTVVFPYISGSFIDRLVQTTDTSFLGRYILIFALFSIVGLILGYVSSRLYMKLQTQIAFRLNADARNNYHSYCNLRNVNGKEENWQRMGVRICLLFYLECHINSSLTNRR